VPQISLLIIRKFILNVSKNSKLLRIFIAIFGAAILKKDAPAAEASKCCSPVTGRVVF
jgi:hypothetical protein